MGLLEGIGSAVSGLWNATFGRLFSPPPPPAPAEPTAKMARDGMMIAYAGSWETVNLGNAAFPEVKDLPTLPKLSTLPPGDSRVRLAREAANSYLYWPSPADALTRPPTAAPVRKPIPSAVRTMEEPGNAFRLNMERMVDVDNKPLEDLKLSELSSEQQAAYRNLATQLQDRPRARLSLQLLLLEGKLTDPPHAKDGKDLLGTLGALSRQPLADGIDRQQLLAELIQEISVPASIAQNNKGTCSVTSIQILMAMEQPAEYARIVSELASPVGQAALRDGSGIHRDAELAQDDGSNRSVPSRLWQPAMMEFASGTLFYDNAIDKNTVLGIPTGSGMNNGAMQSVIRALMGGDVVTYRAEGKTPLNLDPTNLLMGNSATGSRSPDALIARIQDSTRRGDPVPVGMDWGQPDAEGKIHGGHAVLVTKIEGDQVFYHNPWGIEEAMSLGTFKTLLRGATFTTLTPQESMVEHREKFIPRMSPEQIAEVPIKGLPGI